MNTEIIKATINGTPVEVPAGTKILEAARKVHIKIPTLCKHQDLLPSGGCGLCIVRVKGSPKMFRACTTPLENGMDITTHDAEIVETRKTVLELILSNHPDECLTCGRNTNCELQRLSAEFGIRDDKIKRYVPDLPKDASTGSIIIDARKCIKCGRCVQVCQEIQNVWALSFLHRGINTKMAPCGDISLAESPCIRCGQCAAHCPTGAIVEKDDVPAVWDALHNPEKFCTVQIAPAVRVSLGEEFGLPPGTDLTKKIYAALRRLGFKAIFDSNFSADLTIMEEASEFVDRFTKNPSSLPLVTSCCPSWTDFMEKMHPDFIDHFSSAKSPQQMMGAMVKTYFAQKNNIDPAKIFQLSIMPCTAKKFELERCKEMKSSGYPDVDCSITTREFARMIKQSGIDFDSIPEEKADSILGEHSGAGVIFGTTGGVMEAALRTAYNVITGKNLEKEAIDIQSVRGLDGVKEATIGVGNFNVRVAVAHGLANVEYILDKVREAKQQGKESPYHFIEVMACPGGCIGGGGQPYGVTDNLRQKRMAGIYQCDRNCPVRCSHDNPEIKKIYADFLGSPRSEKAHELLHTHYQSRPIYQR
ncbi:MAG: ferredoxin [Verrucomicrobia bacterium GWC2_42_7]|nr:MAG: ferredoxin [Verrucomicrobia bacterium GWC2_42_7]